MKNPFLIGDTVYLRPLEPEDAGAMVPWMNDSEVTRSLKVARPTNLADERAFIERVTKSDKDISVAIMTRAGDRFIGTAALMMIQWRERQACFGISIGDKAQWGRGYGTEVAELLTAHAFQALNLNRVWLYVYDFNTGGMRAYEKAGFRREGVLRQGAFVEGAYRDVHVMATLREEWLAARPAHKSASRAGKSDARARRSSAGAPNLSASAAKSGASVSKRTAGRAGR